jgi:hypothetical protein
MTQACKRLSRGFHRLALFLAAISAIGGRRLLRQSDWNSDMRHDLSQAIAFAGVQP